ncbi:MAG: permease-like cell division protein FtsX [bacterium]|nr:permease-like cell division protein FtsX [bacterium]
MNKFILFERALKSGLTFFKRNTIGITATIIVLCLSLSLITGSFLFKGLVDFFVDRINEKIDISVYFNLDAEDNAISALKDDLKKMPEVKAIEYISPSDTLEEFKEKHKNDDTLMQSLDEIGGNPFSASLNIKAYNSSDYSKITSFIESSSYKEYIEKVDYQENRKVIENLFSTTKNVNNLMNGLIILTSILAILVAFNTLRLIIYNAREEVNVMRLVGASDWFIRGPFLIQGVLVGLISAFATFIFFAIAIFLIDSKIADILGGFSLFGFFASKWPIIFLINLLVGVGLGVISTLIAIRRYLKI